MERGQSFQTEDATNGKEHSPKALVRTQGVMTGARESLYPTNYVRELVSSIFSSFQRKRKTAEKIKLLDSFDGTLPNAIFSD